LFIWLYSEVLSRVAAHRLRVRLALAGGSRNASLPQGPVLKAQRRLLNKTAFGGFFLLLTIKNGQSKWSILGIKKAELCPAFLFYS